MFRLLFELNRGVPNGTLRGVRGRGKSSLLDCDERRRQMTDEENKAENTFSKKIGKTNYKVTVHFSETSDETITDKINRLIQKECEDMSYKKDEEIS